MTDPNDWVAYQSFKGHTFDLQYCIDLDDCLVVNDVCSKDHEADSGEKAKELCQDHNPNVVLWVDFRELARVYDCLGDEAWHRLSLISNKEDNDEVDERENTKEVEHEWPAVDAIELALHQVLHLIVLNILFVNGHALKHLAAFTTWRKLIERLATHLVIPHLKRLDLVEPCEELPLKSVCQLCNLYIVVALVNFAPLNTSTLLLFTAGLHTFLHLGRVLSGVVRWFGLHAQVAQFVVVRPRTAASTLL